MTTLSLISDQLPAKGEDTPLSTERIEAVRAAVSSSLSPRTRQAYRQQFEAFERWCAAHGRSAMPCEPLTLAAYAAGLQDGTVTGRAWAPSSIEVAVSAVIYANRLGGNFIDRKTSLLADAVAGAKVEAGKRHVVRRVRPVKVEMLKTLLSFGDQTELRTVRDNAVLALGFGAALRRVEVAGLDWLALGDGRGHLIDEERGFRIALATSKSSQGKRPKSDPTIPRDTFPAAIEALNTWAARAELQTGAPVCQSIRDGKPTGTRLTDRQIARIVQGRIYKVERAMGRTDQQARAVAALYSGHSLRAGFITSAVEAGVPTSLIQEQSRHSDANSVSTYVREVDAFRNNPLNAFGF